jgi:hypothetical protein
MVSTAIELPDVLVITGTGTLALTTSDHVRIVKWIRSSVRTLGSIRVLLRLDGFSGRVADDLASDAAVLWLRDDEPVRKRAVVGDRRWKDRVFTMVAQPVRGLPIDYFETETAARAWLGTVSALSHGSRAATPE